MKRKNQWLLFAILLLALINLSPSQNSTLIGQNKPKELQTQMQPNQVKVQDLGEITVAVQLTGYDFIQLQQLNQQFMDTHPLKVELVNIPANEDYGHFKQKLNLGESPDVLLLDNTWVRSYAAEGYLLPTDSYYTGSLAGEVLSASLVQNEWNGYVWGVPYDIDPYVWIYNSSLFKSKFGVDFPVTLNEWSTFIEKYKLQGEGIPSNIFAFHFSDPYASLSLLWQLGGLKLEADQSPFVMTEYIDLAVKQLDSLRPYLINLDHADEVISTNETWGKLNGGEVAAALVRYTEASSNFNSNLRIEFMNREEDIETMWISGRSYVVSARTDNKEAAGLWITEMTSMAKQQQWFEKTDYLPVYKSMYNQNIDNGLPQDIPGSLIEDKKSSIPVGITLPVQMEQFSKISNTFYSGDLSLEMYLSEMNNISTIDQ